MSKQDHIDVFEEIDFMFLPVHCYLPAQILNL